MTKHRDQRSSSVLGSSAVMAAGTMVSRLSGYLRTILLAAALGNMLHADVFNIANTIPNMVYILLAGGIFNAVLVPQLVRSMKNDPDGGEAYTNRIITLAALFLGTVTVLLVIFAPVAMGLFLDSSFDDPALAAQRDSIVDFARFCLPQVFFYGMFVLVGQILNSRGRFGPMMWAPIANNVISVAILGIYLLVFGAARGAEQCGPFSTSQEMLLGIGSTLGIVAQFAILLPYLRAAGFRYRPRFDFRGTGLGHTLRLGVWTVLFVVVNQIAYTVVVRLASSGTASTVGECGQSVTSAGTGYTVYSNTYLMAMVPHAIITVSLATAVLPALSRRAADVDLRGLAATLSSTLRTALALIIPFAALLPFLADPIARIVWGYGAAADSYQNFAPSLALFAPALFFFTIHYFMLRGFYALERTRTVFFIQCAVSASNIALAVVLVGRTDASFTSPALVIAFGGAYAVGATLSFFQLRHALGGLELKALVSFLARTALAALIASTAAWLTLELLTEPLTGAGWFGVAFLLGVTGLVDVVVFAIAASAFQVREVSELIEMISRRLPLPRRR
ncbi:murein biosynthesis integral membrane protein MurJ [Nocardioides sp. Bht2]|uniref:murein biosynthesis integral membrane protein MurJ n=1 Tax=Nocardioides sp. Bht2 TaxID=3392297 RepID=UPI0039B41BE2